TICNSAQKAANDWYQRFYRTDYQGVQ
ncbi:hypothetical protein, partial [Salmonella enterica]